VKKKKKSEGGKKGGGLVEKRTKNKSGEGEPRARKPPAERNQRKNHGCFVGEKGFQKGDLDRANDRKGGK